MSVQLRDLIRAVRQAKSMAEERAVIYKECALIRTAFKEKGMIQYRCRNVAKLMYVDMLGYPTHFGQMEVLKLIASQSYSDKRVGYLGLMVLLDERTEVLMLVTQSLQNDLHHTNPFIVGLALCALGNIASADISRDLATEIEKLMRNANPYIRKKATLCAIRILRKVPDLVEDFIHGALSLLEDKSHGPLLSAISLIIQIIELDKKARRKVRKHVPQLITTLKQLVLSSYDPDHDVAGVTDPFLQVKIIQLLRKLSVGHSNTSDEINDVLTQVATNTEATKNPGNAILYECVQTIMSVEAETSLRVLAINILGRFLSNRDNNIRYVALNTLCKAEKTDSQAIQRHRNTIVDCLKDVDISIRRRALDLIYTLVNKNNVRALIRELLNYLVLASADVEFKSELTAKICSVVERFAPSKRWHIDTIIKVLETAGNLAQEHIASNLVVLISNEPDLHAYSVHKLYRSLVKNTSQAALVRVGAWCIGEYGEYLVTQSGVEEAQLGSSNFSLVQETDVVNLFQKILKNIDSSQKTRAYVLTAALKLTTRFTTALRELHNLLESYKSSISLELQQRSVEYINLIGGSFDEIRDKVVGPMPALDISNLNGGDEKGSEYEDSSEPSDGDVSDASSDDYSNDSQSEPEPEPAVVKEEKVRKAKSKSKHKHSENRNLSDVLSVEISDEKLESGDLFPDLLLPTVSSTADQTSANDFLTNLFENSSSAPAQKPPDYSRDSSDFLDLAFTGLSVSNVANTPPVAVSRVEPPAKSPSAVPPMVVFNEEGVKITFSFDTSGPRGVTAMLVTFNNSHTSNLENLEFKVAVPRFLKLQLKPPSSTTVPARSSSVTQNLSITNTMVGEKKIVMKLRISYALKGVLVKKECHVSNFPM